MTPFDGKRQSRFRGRPGDTEDEASNVRGAGSVIRVHGGGNPCERGLSEAASRGAPVAQDRPEIAAVTHELGSAITDWS